MDFSKLKGLYETFGPWFTKVRRVRGTTNHSFYWLELFVTHEPIGLVGLIAGVWFLFGPHRDTRLSLITVYGFGTLLAYSVIPYKTPWCMVSIIWPFFFSAAAGLSAAFEIMRPQSASRRGVLPLEFLIWTLLTVTTLWQCIRLNFYHQVDDKDSYVYVQTYDDVHLLTDPLRKNGRCIDPSNYQIHGLVVTNSPHPIPWLIGNFSKRWLLWR